MAHKVIKKVAAWAVVLGAINWGLAVFDVNLVSYIPSPLFQNIVYGVIGVSGIYVAYDIMQRK